MHLTASIDQHIAWFSSAAYQQVYFAPLTHMVVITSESSGLPVVTITPAPLSLTPPVADTSVYRLYLASISKSRFSADDLMRDLLVFLLVMPCKDAQKTVVFPRRNSK